MKYLSLLFWGSIAVFYFIKVLNGAELAYLVMMLIASHKAEHCLDDILEFE